MNQVIQRARERFDSAAEAYLQACVQHRRCVAGAAMEKHAALEAFKAASTECAMLLSDAGAAIGGR